MVTDRFSKLRMLTALNRAELLAEDLLVGDEWFVDAQLWDDGDFEIQIMHTFPRPPGDRWREHRETIRYRDTRRDYVYSNFVETQGFRKQRCLKEFVIETEDRW